MYLSTYRRPPTTVTRPMANSGRAAGGIPGLGIVRQNRPEPNRTGNLNMSPQRRYQPPPSAESDETNCTTAPENQQGNELIKLKVCDDMRHSSKEFECPRNVLIAHMKYFESHLQDQHSHDIEISVHCDLAVFEWLYQYMMQPITPVLEISKVISILISSDFLQMHNLTKNCLKFIRDHLNEVVKLPIDMSCLNTTLLKQLTTLVSVEELDVLNDPRNRLKSKLFMNKLGTLLEDEANALYRCVYCNTLFTQEQKGWMVCDQAKIFIDFHGQVIAQHVPDRNWQLNKLLRYLESKGLSWQEIYWKVWARLISFDCVECGKQFVGAELSHCSYHPEPAKFPYGSNVGHYQCCKQQAMRFDTSIVRQGCSAQHHIVSDTSNLQYQLLLRNFSMCEEPFGISEKISINQALPRNLEAEECDEESEDEDAFQNQVGEYFTKQSKVSKANLDPSKARAWKLDLLRLNDFSSMRKLTSELLKVRHTRRKK